VMATIYRVLGIRRRHHLLPGCAGGRYRRADDDTVMEDIRAVTNSRDVWLAARVGDANRTFRAPVRKRIRRVMQRPKGGGWRRALRLPRHQLGRPDPDWWEQMGPRRAKSTALEGTVRSYTRPPTERLLDTRPYPL
jgi:hypothetical protein